jgi:RHS repeat-associated protein
MTPRVFRLFSLICLVAAVTTISSAQVMSGRPPFSSAMGGSVDTIDLANLNAHLTIPVLQKAGRGMPFNYLIQYDSSIWQPVDVSGVTTWEPTNSGAFGWNFPAIGTLVITSLYESYGECLVDNFYPVYGLFVEVEGLGFEDSLGTVHPLPLYWEEEEDECTDSNWSGYANPGPATDGSGYAASLNSGGSPVVTARNGEVVYGATTSTPYAVDANGNEITVNSSGQFFDTLSSMTPTLTVTGTAPSNTTFAYVAPSGANATYTMKYRQYTVETNFGCSNVTEYGANGTTTQYLVSEIDLPDIGVNSSDKYTFTYEATPGHSGNVTGRLASVEMPTGGTITYSYSGGTGTNNSGIVCADGSTATLTRQTPDGTWTYAHSESGTQWTTNVTDPLSNNSVLNFQTIYLTERQVYEGSVSPSNLLKTTVNCYNGSTPTGGPPATCDSDAITLPITKKTTYTIWPGTNALQSEVVMSYNGTSGLGTETDQYAYGPGAPGALVRKTMTSYAGLSNGIQNAASSVIVYNGSGGVVAETVNGYDQWATTATTNTPQHITVSGSHGNLTTTQSYVTGSSYLTKTFTYWDTGNVYVATDYNGAQTTTQYNACGNSFPTTITEPIGSMTQTMTWNCTGGVETSSTDENGQTTYYDYTTNAYFWLPDYTKDPAGYQTNFSYTGLSSMESSMLFNGNNSTVDVLSTADSLGRPYLSQVREGPNSSTYDTTETDYNSDGMAYKVSLPFAHGAGVANPSATYQKEETFDALGRPTQITDNGSPSHLTVTLMYNQNDAYRSRGPAPSGENQKQRQYEYDALGRLTSVCEITSMTGSGTCGQTVSKTGYWTKYTYDPNNNLTGVTQNAQASSGSQQARTYTYDMLGRMTSECNPETGNITSITACPTASRTTSYTYDSDSTCGTSKGDLVKKVDPAGNVTCYAYDAMHRGTSIIVNSGPMSSSTPKRYFVYDSATINGTWTMAYAKSRQAEAYTCSSCPTTKLTDIGFSYSVRGEVANLYEKMPNSGGYYNISQTYWANGTPDVMSGLSSLPTITYTPDGEGRINSAAASSGQSPLLSSTSYDVSSNPTGVNFGSLDSDAFTYDPNTERMTKYQLNVGGQSVVGQLAWNAIGTLQQLAITDPFNSANNQTCSYVYDDLNRVQSVSCGTTWSQTFSYDAFGNVAKSGSSSFGAIYTTNPPTNQYSSIGGSGASYDNNGDVTNDYSHTYAWDANGNPVTIDTVSVTYDALGRMVEQNRSGSYTEIVYGPSGAKLGLMTGLSTLQKGYVPLTGGTMAVYNASGLAYYRHSDWEGTSRFASTPSRTKYFDGAYAPFGESYATSGTTDLSYTGQQQDTVSNLYDFPARRYGPISGRWSSPDPAGTASASPMNPQSWNRYAYAFNNPLGFVDTTGTSAGLYGESPSSGLCLQLPKRETPGWARCGVYGDGSSCVYLYECSPLNWGLLKQSVKGFEELIRDQCGVNVKLAKCLNSIQFMVFGPTGLPITPVHFDVRVEINCNMIPTN